MPRRTKYSICKRCRKTFVGEGGICSSCRTHEDTREPAHKRGYDAVWRKIRKQVLREFGIPKDQWHLYAVDHNPPYNKEVEPDHTKYTLIPRLIIEHNRKTAKQDTKRDEKGRFTRGRG
ncbi:MAG: hypothetical protein K9L75_04195 [Spirochaetia bacterium]|nr:hypothetical protein [Spirochaetia bacterium]